MQVISVNVGAKTPIKVGDREAQTGIFKKPVDHSVEVKALGITGDQVLDGRHHGGVDQAVYLYRAEDYAYWTEKLGRDLAPGTFGENLTLAGLPEPSLGIGDRLVFDQVELEITAPRIPCGLFAARMGDKTFAKQFFKAERPGFYARVLKSGIIQPNESFTTIPANIDTVSTVQFFRDLSGKLDEKTLRHYLSLPISVRVRDDFSAQLEKVTRS